ncbi:MAG: hypothetical protein LBE22_05895 [Azoarcus sp.]|nr:hypothetical protein [Azoarcus sp.]
MATSAGTRQECEVSARGMLDLSAHAVQAHFAQTRSVSLLAAVFGMDATDKWAADFSEKDATPEERMLIRDFLSSVEQVVEQGLPVLDQAPERFSDLVAYLTTSRCICLLRYVAHHNPAFMDRLAELVETEDSDAGVEVRIVIRRLVTLAKNEILARIFSKQAIDSILEIMRSYD